jgi:hypothetical protein
MCGGNFCVVVNYQNVVNIAGVENNTITLYNIFYGCSHINVEIFLQRNQILGNP